MSGARIGRAAAALLCAMCAGSGSTASRAAEEAGAPASGVPALRISGEVRRGDRFQWPVSATLRFALLPVDGEGPGSSGWRIAVLGADSTQDYVGIATPPYHGLNERVIEAWHFRGRRSAGSIPGAVNAPQTERGFYFVTNTADYEAYRAAVDAVLWPEGLSDAAVDSIQAAMDQIPRGEGVLTIRAMALDGLGPGESPWFERMRFDVMLTLPGDPK